MFTTHLFGKEFLPQELFDETPAETKTSPPRKGRGRLIVVVRNLKDAMCSLHYFRGTPADDWDGNEHGPGSFKRFIDLRSCPNAMGSAFRWMRENSEAVNEIGGQRALVIHYEALKTNFTGQLKRLNDFLGLPTLTEAKANAIAEACNIDSMKNAAARFSQTARKGQIGDWKNYLDGDKWAEFDRVFNQALCGVEMVEPMRAFQYKNVSGMPKRLTECDLNTDPRSWPPYLLVKLQEGMLVPDSNRFQHNNSLSISTTQFSATSTAVQLSDTVGDGSPRYHLFASASCPLSAALIAARALLGLENTVSMDITDGQSGSGWVFLNGATCSPWKDCEGPFWLVEAYELAYPLCNSQILVPVLWDSVENQIVSNNSWTIMKLLSDAKGGLLPKELDEDCEKMHSDLTEALFQYPVITGVEYLRSGRFLSPIIAKAQKRVFTKLGELEALLGKSQYLLGDRMTGVDIYLAIFLFQFDAVYLNAFDLRESDSFKGAILTGDIYPNLKAFARRMYSSLKPTIHFESFRQVFRIDQAITFTEQSYSWNTAEPSNCSDETTLLPDLSEIVAALETTE